MSIEPLEYVERLADGAAAGLLVLHHGRGSDEHDLIGLADALDPERQLHVVSPRAPLQLPGMPGYHWYIVQRVGYPDRATFDAARTQLAAFHDQLWQQTGCTPEQTVLAGFSMGAVMSFATGLSADRPSVAGIVGFSGFVPTVEGWCADLERHGATPVFIRHGRQDPVISVEFARSARELLAGGGIEMDYGEHDGAHWIEPGDIAAARSWIYQAVGA